MPSLYNAATWEPGPTSKINRPVVSLIGMEDSQYYFDEAQFGSPRLDDLKFMVESQIRPIAQLVADKLHQDIGFVWTRRDTFGYILIDFEDHREEHERLIGKGEIDLFRKLRSTYYCVVLSKKIDRNFKEFQVDGRRCVRVNLTYFKEFLSVIRDRSRTVGLFLYRFSSNNEEELVRRWLRSYPSYKEVRKEAALKDIDAITEILDRYDVKTPGDLEDLITIARTANGRIRNSPAYFRQRLDEFQAKIDGDASEDDLRRSLFENPWLLDFQYLGYDKFKEEPTGIGDADITLYKDSYGIERVVLIEMKKATKKLTETSYRGPGKPVIRAEVGKAISQAIHYLDRMRNINRTASGFVIVGRRKDDSDGFIERFNQYLHGVQVMTYDEICDRARSTIDAFDYGPSAASS
jgi:hypothetical protein